MRAYLRRADGWLQAKRWLREGLATAGLAEADLSSLKRTNARKVVPADLLWRHTAVMQRLF